MKILYICSTDLTGEFSSLGSVRHIMEVSENLFHLANQIKLIAPNYARYPHPTPVDIIYVPLVKVRFLRTIIYEILAPFYMLSCLFFWKPDVIYWRQAYLTIFPVFLSRLFGKKIITEINGLTLDEVESEPLSSLRKAVILGFERFNYFFSSHLICVTPKIRLKIIDHYRLSSGKVSAVLNGVNANRMPIMDTVTAKQKVGLDSNVKVVGFVGHFFPWDGIEYLIEAAPRIIKEFEKVCFLIIGHGRWGEHLPELAAEKGLNDHFVFTGKVPWEELYYYINAFDVATAPYSSAINLQSGRSSLKILEYFACQKPVVASRTDVIPEIVDLDEKGLGITVEPENVDELANAILVLLKNNRLKEQMGSGGRDYVERERSWVVVAQKTQLIMKRLEER